MFDSTYHTNTMVEVRARNKEEKGVKVDKIIDGLKKKMDKFVAQKLNYYWEGERGHGYRQLLATFVKLSCQR